MLCCVVLCCVVLCCVVLQAELRPECLGGSGSCIDFFDHLSRKSLAVLVAFLDDLSRESPAFAVNFLEEIIRLSFDRVKGECDSCSRLVLVICQGRV